MNGTSMFLRTEILEEVKLAGMRTKMSFSDNKTRELWQNFMPRLKGIRKADSSLYSVEVYPHGFFDRFGTGTAFEKWAAVGVTALEGIPDEMETLILPRGLYAVFLHKGTAADAPSTYGYIFSTWLPGSGFLLDDRPHFAIMGEKYKKDDPNSEEEIWIPVKYKN
jgi:AraC family transcriptional regulator